jgi:phosphatidylglycerophosphate synthase
MDDYQPTSRRPIADIFRRTAVAVTKRCVRIGVHPDIVSYASVAAALGAAFCFWKSQDAPWLLLIAPFFCLFRLYLNMLDGMVAIAAGKASWRGEILNDLPDRVSDVIIFVGAAHSGWMNPFFGYWATIFALLTAYVGIFGQALGGRREFGGWMSKPWRMVALSIGSWIMFALYWWNSGCDRAPGLSVLDWTCLLVIGGCVQTMVVRLKRIMAAVQDKRP